MYRYNHIKQRYESTTQYNPLRGVATGFIAAAVFALLAFLCFGQDFLRQVDNITGVSLVVLAVVLCVRAARRGRG